MSTTNKIVHLSLIICAVLMFILKTGNSLKCFECNSHIHKDCSSKNIPLNFSKNCNGKSKDNFVACRKITQVIDFEVNGLPPDSRIIRTCAYERQDLHKCYQRSGFGGRQDVCACNTDNCNNSTKNKFSLVILVATIIIAYLSSAIIYL